MKTEFTAKYLQHLNSKKREGGFTLIELLVVIIIVGVLAAIALPSFLNQIGKARGSEAKAAIGTVNRSQQSYRLENNTMANALTLLDAKISGKFYTYAVPAGTATTSFASVTASTTQADLKGYTGGVVLETGTGTETFAQVVCESRQNVASGATATAPAAAAAAALACNAADRNVD